MLSRLSIPIRLLLLLAVPLAALMIVGLAGLASINATGATAQELESHLAQQRRLEMLRATVSQELLGTLNSIAMGRIDAAQAQERVGVARTTFSSTSAAYLSATSVTTRARAEKALAPATAAMTELFAQLDGALLADDLASVRSALAGDAAKVRRLDELEKTLGL